MLNESALVYANGCFCTSVYGAILHSAEVCVIAVLTILIIAVGWRGRSSEISKALKLSSAMSNIFEKAFYLLRHGRLVTKTNTANMLPL
ncbi:MAG: hypothetical protein CME50_03355 [Halieaceae bacterium]|nr:hypothetical protein [Halieaceae bacterium]